MKLHSSKLNKLLAVPSALLLALSVVSCDSGSPVVIGHTGAAVAPVVDELAAAGGAAVVASQAIVLSDEAGSAVEGADADSVIPPVSTPEGTQAEGLLAAIAASKEIRVMSVGDSITQGVGGAKSYRSELKQLIADAECPMRLVGTQSATSYDVGFYSPHEGYSGHSADDFLSGSHGSNQGVASAVNVQKPDVVLLHVGSVDIFLGQDVASTMAEIDQMIAAIHNAKSDTLIFIANVIPWHSTVDGLDRPGLIETLGDQVEMYVNESSNPLLYLVDVRSGFTADLLQEDLIHPNAAGDAHIADAFFDHIYSSRYCR